MRALLLLATAAACMAMPGPQSFTPDFQASRAVGHTRLGDIMQEFGLDVSLELQKPGNVVISPLSISALLSVLMMGTAGRSHLQLRRALHLPDTLVESDINLSFEVLLENISRNGPDVTLNVANGLFLQRGTGIIYDFTQKARTHYNCVVTSLDFNTPVEATETATDTINKWVKESTNGMISELFKLPLSPLTTFVAVNTVFFNGKWLTPFDPSLTNDRDFYTGAGNVQVPMMSGTITVNYVNIPDLNAHMAALPYKGGRQAMYIILPKGNVTDKLEPLEQELSADRLNSFINNMTSVEMRVWLPRMRLTFRTSLKDTLTSLGVDSIFNSTTADFSRMTSQPVWVDDVVHETVIEVTEEGTKAAAATAAAFERVGNSMTFIVNRPAIFFIRDVKSGVPLFWGKLVQPEALKPASSSTSA